MARVAKAGKSTRSITPARKPGRSPAGAAVKLGCACHLRFAPAR